MKEVTAAIIINDNKVFIARRAPQEKFAEGWEFPGGKIEIGETPEECLYRELFEELSIDTKINGFFTESIYEYPQGSIKLLAYITEIISGELTLKVHDAYVWARKEELLKYDLLPADIPIAKKSIGGITMSFIPSFKVGETVENSDIVTEFKCGNMGGMRRSRNTDTLVIISDHTKGIYEDKWLGDVLHYTGMGKSGDQELSFMQNKTLLQSDKNGVEVHLFEALKTTQYIYSGVVRLAEKPYQEIQKGEDGVPRKVWMFPVRLTSGNVPLDAKTFQEYIENKRRSATRLSIAQLKQKAEDNQSDIVGTREVVTSTFVRDPYISEYVKKNAAGYCQLCGGQAPFCNKVGQPYLETHHIKWLSEGGTDTLDNTVALCPNCHRKMHILNLENDRKLLLQKARQNS